MYWQTLAAERGLCLENKFKYSNYPNLPFATPTFLMVRLSENCIAEPRRRSGVEIMAQWAMRPFSIWLSNSDSRNVDRRWRQRRVYQSIIMKQNTLTTTSTMVAIPLHKGRPYLAYDLHSPAHFCWANTSSYVCVCFGIFRAPSIIDEATRYHF